MSESKQTPGQELSDLFYGLQITTKIMESLYTEYLQGIRSQEDFQMRWNSQSWLLASNLKTIKPLAEKFISEGYNKYEPSPNSPDTDRIIQSGSSSGLVEDAPLSPE